MTTEATEANQNNTVLEIGPRIVHLVSGDDIIGKVSVHAAGYEIEKPISIAMSPSPNGQGVHVSILPLRPYAAEIERMFIDGSHVIFITELSEQMLKSYTAYTSNIVLPNAPSLSSLLS